MSGALKKTMIYLGLADAEEAQPQRSQSPHIEKEVAEAPRQEPVRAFAAPEPVEPSEPEEVKEYRAPVTPIKRAASAREEDGTMHQITTVHPRSYNDAKIIGESFRSGIPVIMNVTDMGEQEAKRLVDFSAGLVFGLRGSIERVTNKVFLLTPEDVEVLGEDQRTSENQEHFFNQS
ncbi:cell division protein SepF [Micrococcoides hystricis]|uniref:Cell division protein SepF n=1 Tax=Micrococcoides hystricis TaxID=1572761 RepID=A0ABV6P6S9_9MICC